ncbi:MAG: helix-turn-helix domain-containing protein [Eubacterium sp.]|nr:helix-turn-helix domain-containing protein [Eubacterium sp.]
MSSKHGAKGKYGYWLTDEGLILLEGWARDGLTDEQIAHNMGISRKTLIDWKNKYSDISNALKKGKEVVDIVVENALFKRACGFTAREEVQEVNPETGILETVKVVLKEIPPDTGAAMAWLKNRRPDKWRDKQSIDIETGASGVILLPGVKNET